MRRLLLIGVGGLVFLCVCMIGLAALSGDDEDGEATAVVEQDVQEVIAGEENDEEPAEVAEATAEPTSTALPTETPPPTETPEPTATPVPTATPEPTATTNPNLVVAGTHLVGTDIEPGLYRGEAGPGLFDSCYWARLSDLSGDLDSILANENSIGQFCVEVMASDTALEVNCQMVRLDPLPEATGEFPTSIGPGMYLVGIDIQPGRYRGEAGADVMDSCYWSRLSNFSGDMGSILANDNSTGQYFVAVQPGDYGLSTACELELVE